MKVSNDKLRALGELAAESADNSFANPNHDESDVPEAGAPHPPRLLTVAVPTHDDVDGAYLSVQALRLYHPELIDRVSILVLDTHPAGPAAWYLKHLESLVAGLRYVPAVDLGGTTLLDLAFRESTSEWVMVVDGHTLLAAGSLRRLLADLDGTLKADDLLHGPVERNQPGATIATHCEPRWRAGQFGTWALDRRGLDPDAPPFDIRLQSLGLLVARRESWLGLNPRFIGPGGEAGYLHERYRQAGRRVRCVPYLRWLTRPPTPGTPAEPTSWEGRIRNYLIGWQDIGADEQEVIDHFTAFVGPRITTAASSRLESERASPFWFFDRIYQVFRGGDTTEEDAWARLERMAGVERARLVDVSGIDHDEAARLLAHRYSIEDARADGLRSILVLDENAEFVEEIEVSLRHSLAELDRREWQVCFLGDDVGSAAAVASAGRIVAARAVPGSAAVAYSGRAYAVVAESLPDSPSEAIRDAARGAAIARDVCRACAGKAFTVVPAAARRSRGLGATPLSGATQSDRPTALRAQHLGGTG